MNKKVSSILLASALMLGSFVPVVANADGLSGKTQSEITFAKPDANIDPVDPENPGTTDPGNPGGTEPGGDLTFIYVSPSMKFGTAATESDGTLTKDSDGKLTIGTIKDGGLVNAIETTANAKTYYPVVTTRDLGATKDNPNLVTEVSDTRGTNAGWTISVSADAMVSGSNSLEGATLSLGGSTATIKNSAKTDGTDAGITGKDQQITLPGTGASSSATIYSAKPESGVLNTAFQLAPENIKLSDIPANVKAGTYSGNVNWTLSDTPGA